MDFSWAYWRQYFKGLGHLLYIKSVILCPYHIERNQKGGILWNIQYLQDLTKIGNFDSDSELKTLELDLLTGMKWVKFTTAAAAAKLLQSCPTLCDPIDDSPPGSPIPEILQARTLEWVAISFSNAWKWKVKVKSFSRAQLLATPWTAAYQAPPSMGFFRQEYWSGVPLLQSGYIRTAIIVLPKSYWQWG